MPRTQVRGSQIWDKTVSKDDLDTINTGKAVITSNIAGNGISLSSTGVDSGTGDVTIEATMGRATITAAIVFGGI